MVPRVEKLLDKSAILKAIEDKRVIQALPSVSPQWSSEVPQVPHMDLSSVSTVNEGKCSLIAGVPVDAPVKGSGGNDVPYSA